MLEGAERGCRDPVKRINRLPVDGFTPESVLNLAKGDGWVTVSYQRPTVEVGISQPERQSSEEFILFVSFCRSQHVAKLCC